MRLFKIKNKEIYNGKSKKDENGVHTYAAYKDKSSGEYRAVPLTHIYDTKRQKQLEKGYLKVEKFKQLQYPTGVKNKYITKDIHGDKLDFGKNTKYKCLGTIPSSQAKRIKDFAKSEQKSARTIKLKKQKKKP